MGAAWARHAMCELAFSQPNEGAQLERLKVTRGVAHAQLGISQ